MSDNENLYASPASDLSSGMELEEHSQKGFFSFSGRIGRIRYLAYLFTMYFAISFVFGFLSGLVGAGLSEIFEGDSSGLVIVMLVMIYIPILVYAFVYAVRRLNDIGWSGFFSLLFLIPGINVLFGLLLVFMPGQSGHNRFGPPPKPNTILTWIAGLIAPVVMIGILAAIAIPAYQDYVERAKQAQQQGQ